MQIEDKINIYMCEFNCHNITVDVDNGVTPFVIPCNFTGRPDRPLSKDPLKTKDGKCTGIAKSMMYPTRLSNNVKMPVPTHEWYRPQLTEYLDLPMEEQKHVDNGGLLLRPRTDSIAKKHSDDPEYTLPDFNKFKSEKPSSLNSIV